MEACGGEGRGRGGREGEGGVATWRPKRLLSSAVRCEGQTDARQRGEQTNELHISHRERKRREEEEEKQGRRGDKAEGGAR